MRISTLNTALQLSLKQDPSKGDGDKQEPQDGQDPQDGKGNGQDDDKPEDGQGKGSDDKPEPKDGQGKSDKSDKPEKGEKGDGEPQDGQDGDDGEPSDGEGEADKGYGDQSGGKGKHQGGGNAGDDLTDVGQQLADAINQGLFGTTDRDDALSDTLSEEVQQADPVRQGESKYNPHLRMYPVDVNHNERDTNSANRILRDIARESGQVKVGLQRLVRAMEQTNVSHGTKDGRLSSRMYVRTWSEIQKGKRPTRPNYKRSEQMDISIACSVVVDQSSSMSGLKSQTIKGMLALADALNGIKAATQVVGFRYGGYNPEGWHGVVDRNNYPNINGQAAIDVFQQFGEKFTAVKGRFAHLRATGGTPTADGMQYSLESLSERNEAFRIMFVLTDGCPDGGHQAIINRQIRIAKEAGIHVIGVGLGRGTEGVVSSYPDHIVAHNMSQLPEKLIAKLRTILKPSANRRGVRVAK